jgi:hypothetical protein
MMMSMRRAQYLFAVMYGRCWRWRHRRCVRIRERRPEYWTLPDFYRVCSRCRDAMIDEEMQSAKRWQ